MKGRWYWRDLRDHQRSDLYHHRDLLPSRWECNVCGRSGRCGVHAYIVKTTVSIVGLLIYDADHLEDVRYHRVSALTPGSPNLVHPVYLARRPGSVSGVRQIRAWKGERGVSSWRRTSLVWSDGPWSGRLNEPGISAESDVSPWQVMKSSCLSLHLYQKGYPIINTCTTSIILFSL